MFKSIARTHEAALFIVTTAFRKPRPFSHIFDFTLLDRTPRSVSDASLNLVSWSVEQNTFLHGHRRQLSKVPVNNNVLLLIHCDSIDSLHFYTHVAIHKNAKNTKFAKLCNSLCCVNWNGEYFRNFFKEITASIVSKSADFNAHIICGKRVLQMTRRWKMAGTKFACQKMDNVSKLPSVFCEDHQFIKTRDSKLWAAGDFVLRETKYLRREYIGTIQENFQTRSKILK